MLILKNKCRGRFHWDGTVDDAMKRCEIYCHQCPPDRRNPVEWVREDLSWSRHRPGGCSILFNMQPYIVEYDDGRKVERHTYFCDPTNTAEYISYWNSKKKRYTTTRDEKEALIFTSDIECDSCMEHLKDIGAKTIVIVSYNEFRNRTAECVHYPNECWAKNGNLQPSLMNKGVAEWNKEHGFE